MPVVEINFFDGRSIEQKRQIAKEITETLARVGGSNPAGVHVIFREIKHEQWAIGGVMTSDMPPKKPTP
jgi:4-oxalocrotonate tautomerase